MSMGEGKAVGRAGAKIGCLEALVRIVSVTATRILDDVGSVEGTNYSTRGRVSFNSTSSTSKPCCIGITRDSRTKSQIVKPGTFRNDNLQCNYGGLWDPN
uniref:Uncharacterized protein n=1 Tax=Pseudo-nitzschia australis TaxID=44445 RepID=A0A7S4EKJ4_9STRA|mmetsp:Transcript_21681/g.45597  ORF Transcript_21681/g.45597 Transcript_21681/m.45597 type:complete len:100 (+) Transcript_21681:38-337(+)